MGPGSSTPPPVLGWSFGGSAGKRAAWPLRGKARQYGCLRPLFRRCGIRPKLRCRGGLPFFIARLWRQKGLAVGSLLGVGVYLFLSGFCWGVTVTGAETLPDSQVLEVARQHGVSLGVSLKGLDAKAAALAIQNDLPGVTWLSINTGGCFVEISLRESVEAPEVVDDREWSNMVATRPGTILSIQAERGRPVVSPGDIVEAGQMLIAGLYEQEQDPHSPPPDALTRSWERPGAVCVPSLTGNLRWRCLRRKWSIPPRASDGKTTPWWSLGCASPWG